MFLHHPRAEATASMAAPVTDADHVRAAIARLSPTDRDLLVLRFRDDRAIDELAAATRLEPGAVRQRLHRAAWAVEDAVGPMPLGEERAAALRAPARRVALAEEEAAFGITPVLAARFVAAVEGETPPAADRRWRWHALLAEVRRHGEGTAAGVLLLAAAVPALVSVAG